MRPSGSATPFETVLAADIERAELLAASEVERPAVQPLGFVVGAPVPEDEPEGVQAVPDVLVVFSEGNLVSNQSAAAGDTLRQPDLARTGKGNQVDLRIVHQQGADHFAVAGDEMQRVRRNSKEADQLSGDRHEPQLLSRRAANRFCKRPLRSPAALCDGRRRLEPAANQLRAGRIWVAGVEPRR